MPKAKELRPFVERLITIAKRGVAAGDANGKTLHARRLVLAELPDTRGRRQAVRDAGAALRAIGRAGYTRLLRASASAAATAPKSRRSSSCGSEYDPKAKARPTRRRKRSRRPRGSADACARRPTARAARKTTMAVARCRLEAREGRQPQQNDHAAEGRRQLRRSHSRSDLSTARRPSDAGGPFSLFSAPASATVESASSKPRALMANDSATEPNVERQAPCNRHTTDPGSLTDVRTARPSPARARSGPGSTRQRKSHRGAVHPSRRDVRLGRADAVRPRSCRRAGC